MGRTAGVPRDCSRPSLPVTIWRFPLIRAGPQEECRAESLLEIPRCQQMLVVLVLEASLYGREDSLSLFYVSSRLRQKMIYL